MCVAVATVWLMVFSHWNSKLLALLTTSPQQTAGNVARFSNIQRNYFVMWNKEIASATFGVRR